MGSHYFVIDRRGMLVGELSLPANETIVGASARYVYVGFKDEDDIVRVRHAVCGRSAASRAALGPGL